MLDCHQGKAECFCPELTGGLTVHAAEGSVVGSVVGLGEGSSSDALFDAVSSQSFFPSSCSLV